MAYGVRRPPDETLYRGVSEAILLARRRAGLSQADVGARLGVTAAAVSDLERAVTRPDLDGLAEIAAALGVPLNEIVVLDERRRQQPDAGEKP